jgi:hypothetical protein
LDTDVQFTTRPIKATVTLNDPGGNNVARNMPETCQGDIADKLKGTVTLGEISKFSYDPAGVFVAEITSEATGEGELSVSFNNKVFSKIEVVDGLSQINENILTYTFIEAVTDPAVRRDESDVAGA